MTRIVTGNVNCRDLLGLASGLRALPAVKAQLSQLESPLLVKINQLGTTVVVVTHEKDLVNRFGKRVVTIESGHVISDQVGGYVGGHIHGKA